MRHGNGNRPLRWTDQGRLAGISLMRPGILESYIIDICPEELIRPPSTSVVGGARGRSEP